MTKKRKLKTSPGNKRDSKTPRIVPPTIEKKKQNELIGSQFGSPWMNLDLILSLKNTKIDLQRKLELAFDFVKLSDKHGKESEGFSESVQTVSDSRLIVFLSDWVQKILSSNDDRIRVLGEKPSLDFRCWEVLKFCLEESEKLRVTLSLKQSLLQAFAWVSENVLLLLNCKELVFVVSECAGLIFSSRGKLFNANVEMWVSTVSAVFELVHKVYSDKVVDEGASYCLLKFSAMVLEFFSSFLKVHPNPKNVFPVFADKLLESSLSLLVELDVKCDGGDSSLISDLLKILEDILSNGLFHSAHLDGFLSISSTKKLSKLDNVKVVDKAKSVAMKSYHRHFFQKLGSCLVEKKMSLIEGLGDLFRLFVIRVKKQKGALMVSEDSKLTEDTNIYSTSRLDVDTSKSLFDLFVQFIEPLVLSLKSYSGADLEVQRSRLFEAYCVCKSANKTLAIFMLEKVYLRTEDTLERVHFNFLKDIYGAIFLFSSKMHLIWLSNLKIDDDKSLKILPLVAKEIIVSLGYLLEIEYEVFEDNLVNLWNILLAYSAFGLSLVDTGDKCLLTSEIAHLGCQVVNLYSELRQVSNPIFALCKAIRWFGFHDKGVETDYPGYLSSATCVKSVTTLLCSQELRVAISKAIKAIPEGQVSGCIRQLKVDILESLEWMKVSQPNDRNEELGEPHLSFQAEIIGRTLSEIYTLILDNATVTAGNSIIVGNSIKEVMASIRPSLSILVRKQTDSVNELLFFITESKSVSPIIENTASWIFLFFFRVYASCRSLYKQSMTLMPPDSSRKSSSAIGDLFTSYSGKDWMEMTYWKDEGYFHWITAPSDSLMSVIQSVSEICLRDSVIKCAPLVYVLHIMAFQRLTDLNRQIKASEFLHEKAVRLGELKLMDDSELHFCRKENKKLNKRITALRQEAMDLTSFVTGYLPLIVEKSNYISRFSSNDYKTSAGTTGQDDDSWDFGVCSASENSLPTAVWWMLCQNTDLWCIHSNEKTLNKFLSCLFQNLVSHIRNTKEVQKLKINEPENLRKVTLGQISLELLSNISFYEEKFVSRQLISRFCHALEKSAMSLFSESMSGDASMDLLPDWSKVIIKMDEMLVDQKDRHVAHCDLSDVGPDSLPFKSPYAESWMEIIACQSLLTFLCSVPKGYANLRSFPACGTHILNLERLVVLSLVDYHGKLYMHNQLELFRLFVCCRRALKWLVMAYCEKGEDGHFLPIPVLSESSFSILWLSKSVSAMVQLLNDFPEECAIQVKDTIFSLMDHTSYVFMTLSKNHSSIATHLFIYDEQPLTELDTSGGPREKDISNESAPSEAWKVVVLMAETLKEQAQSFLIYLRTNFSNLIIADLNKISSTISCFQGFLWGLACAEEKKLLRRRLAHDYKVSYCIKVFEDFVNFCLHALVVEDNGNIDTLFHDLNFHNMDNKNDSLNTEDSSKYLRKFSGDRTEVSSDLKDDQESTRNPGTIGVKSSSSRKKELKSALADRAADILIEVDSFERKYLKKPLLRSLLRGENQEIAFSIKQLFIASSAILRLKFRLFYNISLTSSIAISQFLLSEVANMADEPHPFSFVWLDGVMKYVEVLGGYISLTNSVSSNNLYVRLFDLHLKAIGRCISLQGKGATLASHEAESSRKTFRGDLWPSKLTLGHRPYSLEEFKVKVRMSFKVFINKPSEFHLSTGLQALERALVGAVEDCHLSYNIKTGGSDGGSVSSVVAAGVDCLDLVLESSSGSKRLKLVKEYIQSYIGALFNIILHLQSPLIFCKKPTCNKNGTNPDPGSVILMCVEILGKVAGKSSLFKMYPCHVGQSLHISGELFRYFLKMRSSQAPSSSSILSANHDARSLAGSHLFIINRRFSIDLFAACCRLLSTVLRHHNSDAARCISLLQDSVCVLLQCLETVDNDLIRRKGFFAWDLHEGITCASFLRRIYEERRRTGVASKLLLRKSGPYRIIQHIGDNAYVLDILGTRSKVVNIKLLTQFYGDIPSYPVPSLPDIELTDEIDEILDSCLDVVGHVELLIRWVGRSEKIRQQKEIIGSSCSHILANYIMIYSGYGPFRAGIRREIDEALRPGVYALIDVCSTDDLQQLHTVLGEGPCRSTLATLQRDYKLNFQFEGKV
ncbi:hypothetical protein GIB67_005121 [Kingdonia uniflora]|uniref:Nucleolar 27S pre-rRNA processing Urb2/Npa2 C-terminal domain-containing protein n=1 Tax=Kingdonia uniflora TaxID=39325 RepID=A0A7J7NDH9_9MAGN|nr:hypothetical protein GIB67_005121 [Kingdonia uniflora]